MSTITLNCSQCNIEFSKEKSEIQRRKYKTESLNWFCSRSCSSKYGNKLRKLSNSYVPTTKPQFGNKYNQKYKPEVSWYVTRIKKDMRKHVKPDDIMEIHDKLVNMWNGKCAISGIDIYRKDYKGKCSRSNPFFVASVDRIDSSRPYSSSNIQWISVALNYAKSNYECFEVDFNEFKNQLLLEEIRS